MAIIGAVFQIGPVVSLAATCYGMGLVYNQVVEKGNPDPAELASSINKLKFATNIGLGFGFLGLILMAVAIFGLRYRAPWIFWFLVIYGILLLFAAPVGTVIGIAFLICWFEKRDEFLHPRALTP